MVVGVGVGLDHDDALEAQALLQRLIGLDREMPGQESPRRAGNGLVVEVHVRVAGAARRLELRLLLAHFFLFPFLKSLLLPFAFPGAFFGAAGFGTSSATVKIPPW